MLTYNTAYDLPGPSRLQSLILARLSCDSNTETKAHAHCSGRLMTSSRHIHLSQALAFRLHLRCLFKFVRLVRAKRKAEKKNSPKTPEDVGWHEALCSGFSASACARWRWREPSGSAPLLADAASGMLLTRGLTAGAFIPEERGGGAVS